MSRSQGRNPNQGQSSVSAENLPQPSPDVTTLEDSVISQPKDGDQNVVPRRPAYGDQKEEDVKLWANYFEIKADKRSDLYIHHISFLDKAREPKGRKLARVVKLLLDQNEDLKSLWVVTDFANTLVSREKLPEKSFDVRYNDEVNVRTGDNAVTYIVKIEYKETLSIDYLVQYLKDPTKPCSTEVLGKIVQALNIFINHCPQDSKDYITIGSSRSFPLSRSSRTRLPYSCFAIKGYYSSIRVATSRILVNINVTHSVFHDKARLDTIMSEFIKKWDDNTATFQKLAASLKGVRIEYGYLKDKAGKNIRRVKTIFGLASPEDGTADKDTTKKQPRVPKYGAKADEVDFWFNNKYITVFEFFKTVHKITVDNTLPLINIGSSERPTYLPPDLCYVLSDQRAKIARYDNDMISHIPKYKPWENARDIEQGGLKAIGFSGEDDGNKKRRDKFGLSIEKPELITVHGRVLRQPTIRYNSGDTIRAIRWNLSKVKLGSSGSKKRWLCVAINPIPNTLKKDIETALVMLQSKLKEDGVYIEDPEPPIFATIPIGDPNSKTTLREVFTSRAKDVDFFLVILHSKNSLTYNYVKRLGDIECGVPTICLVKNTLIAKPGDDDIGRHIRNFSGNLALKLNLKFSNNNQIVDPKNLSSILNPKDTMIVGIDVTHSPVPDQPSIAGMVASVDGNLGQWPGVLRHQGEPRVEMVTHLQEMLETRLKLWSSRNKCYPKNILVYRDGVSEGQYKLVIKEELPKLKAACTRLCNPTAMPKLTIVVVGKRHHTRFYAGDNKGNPSPGTVVDRGITEALNWDFFLQSHKPIIGTVRPAHYFVVHDEIFRDKFKGAEAANMLETFTHSLCYIFGRSTGPVSICTPAYYADIACDRARCYVAAGTTHAAASQAQIPGSEGLLLHPNMKDSMFYI
ncbi:Piwi-domain-containing protein [Daldinia vernicosa]|uniref:Piwi-domain-containing protein n=1 Tax=Daldinia vernicosa TaxID=114800 RepID=UPI00200762FA|nr:Piwi-domain-containing protein [Daldinia vernicosa]KAI0850636.1 Piwi-domain-containing protein [Daldinia vernicosa]